MCYGCEMNSEINQRVTLLVGENTFYLIKESKISWAFTGLLKRRAKKIVTKYPWASSEQYLGSDVPSILKGIEFILSVPHAMTEEIEEFLHSDNTELDITKLVPVYAI